MLLSAFNDCGQQIKLEEGNENAKKNQRCALALWLTRDLTLRKLSRTLPFFFPKPDFIRMYINMHVFMLHYERLTSLPKKLTGMILSQC